MAAVADIHGWQEDLPPLGAGRGHLRRLLAFARPWRARFALALAGLLGIFAMDLAGPLVLRLALDGPVRERLEGGDPAMEGVLLLGAAYLVVQALRLLLVFANELLMNTTGQAVIRAIREKLFSHVLALPIPFFERNPTGRLVTRMTSDVENLNEMLSSGVVVTLFDLLKILGLGAALFLVDWRMALLALVATPVIGLISAFFHTRFKASYRGTRTALGRQNAFLAEAISGIRTVRLFGREGAIQERHHELNRGTESSWLRTVLHFAMFLPLVDLSMQATRAGLLWVGGAACLAGELTVGAFLQFWVYFDMLARPVQELGEKYNLLQSAMASSERIFRILDEEETVRGPAAPRAAGSGPARVEFERVRFSYDGAREVLRGVSFTVEAGQRVAVVGATGAGKSTLVNLLCRFYDVHEGRVLVDGADVREMDPRALRRRIALVPQEVFLFSGDVLENVRLWDPAITPERVRECLAAVHALPFVETLPGGLRAPVQERGATLSAGQRQLLSFARALAHDPDILVLDEATASVDSETEAVLQKATERLTAGRTCIVIAHRISTIRACHRILVFHHGELREQGTHEELLSRGGIYARLHLMGFEDPA